MSNYSKLWGAIGGYLIGAVFAYLAYANLATCTDSAIIDTCTIFGLSPAIAQQIIGGIFGAAGTFIAPANKPA